jgi:heme A synthase
LSQWGISDDPYSSRSENLAKTSRQSLSQGRPVAARTKVPLAEFTTSRLLVLNGEMGWWTATTAFTAPVLAGNIVGGTALFTLVAHAQVMKEI